jgi:beta-glucosidase
MLRFPVGLWLGAATSSYQVEGACEASDWWAWEREPGRIRDGTRSGLACDWWAGRAEDDLALAASFGHDAHRLSLEWSRLEPAPGRYHDAAFARYQAIFAAAQARGLALMVTANHFTLPRWAQSGWLDPELPERFAGFAAECVRRLGRQVALWATLNEPAVLALMGYGGTRWPPGEGKPAAARRALVNMLRAHALAHAAMKRAGDAQVGLVVNAPAFEPASAGRLDRLAAAAQRHAFNETTLLALEQGRMVPPLGAGERIDGLAGAYDFIGLNYYGRYRVRFDARAPATLFGRHLQDHNRRTEWTDWGEVWPDGLATQLERLQPFGVPLYVTENGIGTGDDAERAAYLVRHLRALHDALERGIDVRGYFHWTLIDNFEWAEGWSTHFGLVAVDRLTQERRPRPSAAIYARICRERGIADDLLAD